MRGATLLSEGQNSCNFMHPKAEMVLDTVILPQNCDENGFEFDPRSPALKWHFGAETDLSINRCSLRNP